MSQKIVNLLAKKLKEQQIIIDILPINTIFKPEKKSAQTLAICSRTLHFLQNNSHKRAVKIESIKLITLAIFSNELIFHCSEEDVWLQSYHNIKIITNLFRIRQQVFNQPTLTACLQKEKSLANYIVEQSKIKKFWQGMFSKKPPQKEEQKMLQRKSFQTIEIKDKNFVAQLSKTIYKHHYKNVQLLHISGQNGFIFNQYEYHKQEVNQTQILYQHSQTKDYVILRKINKGSIEESNKKIRRYLQNYKLQDYNQQILFAIQTLNYYEIITPYLTQQKTLEHLINQEVCISEIDLISIFYKLMSFITNNFNVLHSLSPKQILIKETIIISSVFCINPQEINISYLSPEEIDPTLSQKMDIEIINLWKIGMLLYQAAFLTVPFPIEYLAQTIASRRNLQLRYPSNNRSLAFKEFLTCLLEIEPQKRGGKNWQKSIYNHKWILKCMK